MSESQLGQLIVIILAALILWWATERFSPDPFITKVVQAVIFAAVLLALLTRFLPVIG